MGINDVAVERIMKLLVEEQAIVKLLKVLENPRVDEGKAALGSSKKKPLMWSQISIEHRMPWLN
ncbi:MAG TPA: hypothetical protein VE593_12285 [Nitrososphaeraceae archaeon]|jgi:hypothetical protein|nr:hypothetical protein [Nitrososphaeraceae archaeon]